ncbi:MAG TPA: hypothetical protein ACFYEF_12595 [Candidatus Wunengus sp. YC63]|uniref:hypothetical protein n=1 Tax=Candidatus Wunengus sp. YC63 TaxID=3367699 RepID=UPI0027127B3B|nr:hypothetical protein [Candidatus Brocadiales bacterium]
MKPKISKGKEDEMNKRLEKIKSLMGAPSFLCSYASSYRRCNMCGSGIIWVVIAFISSIITGLYSYKSITDTLVLKYQYSLTQASITLFTLNAFFSLYVTGHLNRMFDIIHKIPCYDIEKKNRVLYSWFVVYIAHFCFTLGIIFTVIFAIYDDKRLIKFGASFFLAGYTSLIISSVQMFFGAWRRLDKFRGHHT